jgi:hypothetical protein
MSEEIVKKSSERQPGRNGGELRVGGPGRPKGSVSITNELKKVLAEDGNAEKVARAIVLHAAKGNGAAIKHILERVDGKLADVVHVSDERRDLSEVPMEKLAMVEKLLSDDAPDS